MWSYSHRKQMHVYRMAGPWLGNGSCGKDIEIIFIANQLWISIIFANKGNIKLKN